MSSASREPAPAPSPDTVRLTHQDILKIVAALVLCLFVSSLSQTVAVTALPTIVGDLGGQDQLAWVAAAMLLTMTVSTPLWGKLSDLYGRKRLMQVAIASFVAASIIAGLATSMDHLIAARALQGIGSGGVISLAQAILGDIVSPRERGRYAGYLGTSFGVATLAGPLIGGFLVDGPGWRWCFYVGVPFAAVASIVLHRTLHASAPRRKARVDWLGAVFITAGASALLLLCSLAGQQFAWMSGWTVLLAAVGLASIALAVAVERRASEPILPPRLFRNPAFTLTVVAIFLVGVAMMTAMVYLPQYLQIVRGKSPTASGMLTLPLILSMLTVAIPTGRAITRWGRWKIFPLVGLTLLALGAALFSTLGTGTSLWLAGAYMTTFGLGLGLTVQTLTLAMQNAADPRDIGVATSSAYFFRSMGGAVGVSVLGAAMVTRMHSAVPELLAERHVERPTSRSAYLGTPEQIAGLAQPLRGIVRAAFASGFDRMYLLAVPVTLLSLLALLAVRETPLRTDRATDPRWVMQKSSDSETEDGEAADASPAPASPRQ